MKTIDSLEDDRVRLQLKIDELENGVRLDGIDVTVTMYRESDTKPMNTYDVLTMELKLQYTKIRI